MPQPNKKRIIWDLTYACPLRCIHCYSESGRRENDTIKLDIMHRIADIIVSAKPERISISGGEPLTVPWWREALKIFSDAKIPTTVFTSGWLMTEEIADDLNDLAGSVAVSIDGASAKTHDLVRGRPGSFVKTNETLSILQMIKTKRLEKGKPTCTFGVDFTVTKASLRETQDFVEQFSTKFPEMDFIRFGAVVPEGLAQEEKFAKTHLLSKTEIDELSNSAGRLKECCSSKAKISVTDAQYFLPTSSLSDHGEMIAHIEPDGQLRAFTTYEAKVGNILDEDFDKLWEKAIAWRSQPDVRMLRDSIRSVDDWARVTRILDRTYGSASDRIRIANRR